MAKIMESNINEVSRISINSVFRGTITTDNDIRVDGKFYGRICTKGKIVVGKYAVIEGDLVCTNIDLWGKLKGKVFVKNTLSLKDSAVLEAEIFVNKVEIALGAKFDGSCSMVQNDDFTKLIKSNGLDQDADNKELSETDKNKNTK